MNVVRIFAVWEISYVHYSVVLYKTYSLGELGFYKPNLNRFYIRENVILNKIKQRKSVYKKEKIKKKTSIF